MCKQNEYDNGSAELGTERIPLSVLLLLADGSLLIGKHQYTHRHVHRDLLLSVDRAARGKVASTQNIFLG